MIIRKRRALNRPGTATHEKGLNRLLSILDAARDVLVEEGYARFTMRKVATRAGISIGNLNYYYRAKEDLMRDLVEYVVNAYLEEFERLKANAGDDAEAQLRAVLAFWIEDLGTHETSVFFPELWALANHDEFVADLVDETYRAARAPIRELLPRLNPALSPREVERLALYICAAMEGLTVFAGHDKPWAGERSALASLMIDNFLTLAKGRPAAAGSCD